jgi:hypothetical protein
LEPIKWTQPVYAAQALTGIAGIGAILVADHITKWHILVSVILATSVLTSLMVVARAEGDAQRNRAHLDTLLRSMELPYFIIEAITASVRSIAKTRDWVVESQENFERETVYKFRASGGQQGRFLVSEQEFKDLWILEDSARRSAIERRLFESDLGMAAARLEEYAAAVVREAIAEHVTGSHWVTQPVQSDGTRVYEVRTTQAAPPMKTVTFSPGRFRELLAMVPPLRRYHELAEEVNRVFEAAPLT